MLHRSEVCGAALALILGLSACKTTTPQSPAPIESDDKPVSIIAPPPVEPQIPPPLTAPVDDNQNSHTPPATTSSDNQISTPPPSVASDIASIGSTLIAFSDYLPGWKMADLRPSLRAFARNCSIWEERDGQSALMVLKPEFGLYQDWQSLCANLPPAPYDASLSRWFFETYFLPANLVTAKRTEGLLTGYYEPEIDVRTKLDAEFSEPILAYPKEEQLKNQTRADIYRSQIDYTAHAYGRPIDVFFMQVQGSGRLRFPDGSVKRAAYGGNNSYKYKSIGRVLIARGEMTREEASKQAIENWMIKSGASAARALMNENKRYIYFALEDIDPSEGPKGSMRAPLTAMGSMAIDPKSRPYGAPVWLETTLPQFSGDYRGQTQSLLVIAQDSGNAIRGEGRGDLFFGSGDLAGELAGVMKHDVTMTHLLPRDLVLSQLGLRE